MYGPILMTVDAESGDSSVGVESAEESLDARITALAEDIRRLQIGHRESHPSKGVVPERKGAPRPLWAKQCKAVERIEEHMIKYFRDDNSKTLTYHLPPPHLFFAGSPSSDITVQKVHNWIRIRPWCFDQINRRDEILMTTYQWRIALEGKYYLTPHDHVKTDIHCTPEEIARLPPPPREVKRRRTEDSSRKGESGPSTNKRVAFRIEINVRFGVHGSFPPYEPTQEAKWGNDTFTAREVSSQSSQGLIEEVVWELSVSNFRLELLALDRRILTLIYNDADMALAARRESAICSIWDNGWVRPLWETDSEPERLSCGIWTRRLPAIRRLASVISLWPGGEHFRTWNPKHAVDERSFVDFEFDVYLFYARMFHRHFGRRPILPMLQPSRMFAKAM